MGSGLCPLEALGIEQATLVLISHDEIGTLRTLSAYRQVIDGLFLEHGGRIANTAGDSVLAEFSSAADAVVAWPSSSNWMRLKRLRLPSFRLLERPFSYSTLPQTK
jgi:hypothetical protein